LNPFSIISPFGTEKEWSESIPPDVKYDPVPHNASLYVHGYWGYIVFQIIRLAGVDIWDSQYYLSCPVELSAGAEHRFIEQHNSVLHHFESEWDGIPTTTERQGQGGFSVGPYMNNTVAFPEAGYYRTTDFHYDPVTLYDYATVYPKVHGLLDHFENKSFHRADGFVDLKGDPSVLLRHIYDPNCRKDMQPKYLHLKAEEFLITALERLHPLERERPFVVSESLADKALHVEQVLQTHYMEPLTLKQLARSAGTNIEYLRQAFRARTGQTVTEYLIKVRIEKAKDYLLDTSLNLESIALETGFCDGDRLGKVFKQHMGMTPMAFRMYGKRGGLF